MTVTISEHKSSSYGPRTYLNASEGDVTIAIASDYSTAGEKLTHKASGEKYLKLDIEVGYLNNARLLWKRLNSLGKELPTINVAGNGIYTLSRKGITQFDVNEYLFNILSTVHTYIPIGKIVSGGQTGIDLAGGVAGAALGIDVVMTLPKGFVQRHEDMKDVQHTEAEIMQQVTDGVNKLKGIK